MAQGKLAGGRQAEHVVALAYVLCGGAGQLLDADVVEGTGGREVNILHTFQLIGQRSPNQLAKRWCGVPLALANHTQFPFLEQGYHLGLVVAFLQGQCHIEDAVAAKHW